MINNLEGWLVTYLLNTLWQTPLLFGAAWIIGRLLRPLGPSVEHRVWVSALVSQTLLAGFSRTLWEAVQPFPWFNRRGSTPGGRISVVIGTGAAMNSLRWPTWLVATIAIAYALTLVFFAARLAWRAGNVAVLHRAAVALQMDAETFGIWNECCERFQVKGARLATSATISSPLTLGARHSLVVLPTAIMGGLHRDDLITVLAHECTHLARRDYLKNLLYQILSLPVSYHPFSWLTREQVLETREQVCDGMAADAFAGRANYARSLLRLASLMLAAKTGPVSNAIGIFDANGFERRIMTLTSTAKAPTRLRRNVLLAVCGVIGLGTCVSATSVGAEVAMPKESALAREDGGQQAATTVPAKVMASQVLNRVMPIYPPDAKEAKIEGIVLLQTVIGKDGGVKALKVISGPKELQGSALDAVRQWTYKPYLLNGSPMEVQTTVTVTYAIYH